MGDYVDPEECNTRLQLGLGLGLGGYAPTPTPRQEMMRMISKDRPPLVEYHKTNMMMIYDQDEEDRISTGHTDSEITTSKYGAMRKKLRLTREQTTLLEDSFKRHSTLNPTQKHALAGRLNLKPRQVEVWFQNRRARTKLKQTEVDCELLKKWCESLSEENRKLKKELQELKSSSSPLLMTTHHQIPNTTTMLTMCSSCERKAKGNGQYHLNNEAVAAPK